MRITGKDDGQLPNKETLKGSCNLTEAKRRYYNLTRSRIHKTKVVAILKLKRDKFMFYALTLRRLMSYIYIYIYIYIYMEHPFLMFLDHTQRRSTVGRTPLDE